MTDLRLFDAQPDWSPERKEAFALYRDLGSGRSHAAVAQVLKKDKSLIDRWGGEDKWQIRVAAWDAEQDRVKQEAALEEARRIATKHAQALEDTITVLMQPAMLLAAKIQNGDVKFGEGLSDVELANLVAAAGKQLPALVQASRLVHGSSTQNVEVKGEHRVKVEGATIADLDAYLLGLNDGAESVIERGNLKLIEGGSSAE